MPTFETLPRFERDWKNLGTLYDPIEVWRGYAADVRGQALDAGHFLAEERPLETLAALRAFLDPGQ